jgi:hypothetical protein
MSIRHLLVFTLRSESIRIYSYTSRILVGEETREEKQPKLHEECRQVTNEGVNIGSVGYWL